jgi:hypothetical protein
MSFSGDCFSTQQGSSITSCESWFLCKYLTKCQCTVLSVHVPCRDFLQPTQPCQYLSPTMSRAIRARAVNLLIILPQADANSCFVRFCTLTACAVWFLVLHFTGHKWTPHQTHSYFQEILKLLLCRYYGERWWTANDLDITSSFSHFCRKQKTLVAIPLPEKLLCTKKAFDLRTT